MKTSQMIKAAVSFCFIGLSAGAAYADAISEVEPNNSIAGAQYIDDSFDVGMNPDITNSVDWPWVSISATGNGTFDYYSFDVPEAGTTGIFDIDHGLTPGRTGSMDTYMFLYDANGNLLARNDDYSTGAGASGSVHPYDSYIQYTFASAGTYVVAVGEYYSSGNRGGISGNTPDNGDTYTLQVSLDHHVIDSDGDGVPDDEDCQPNSDLNPTVTMEDCDSGAENILMEDGCTIADLVFACADDSRNHGAFASCVSGVTKVLQKEGHISGGDKGAIQSCAARSNVGKPDSAN